MTKRILIKTAEFLTIATLVAALTYTGEMIEISRQVRKHLRGR
jgi:hypothetical protein